MPLEAAYLNELQEFVNCIIEKRKPDVTVYDGTKSTEIALRQPSLSERKSW